jgi:RHS repeat-associated protein
VPLHEWQTTEKEPLIDIIAWVFEEGTFVPAARIKGDNSQSIITDYLGTPTAMYDAKGEKTWEANLDIYGRVRTFDGRSLKDCPFRYQGQYEDAETGLYYNRFRYYDPTIGNYISQDPIGLAGSNPTLYGYVKDVNKLVDFYGLATVDANFEWDGPNGEFENAAGVNPTERPNRATSGVNDGLRGPNSSKANMHAEIEAMTTVKGRTNGGGHGTLTIKGKNACPYCKGDIKTLARQMNLDSLRIIDTDGTEYLFDKKGLNTIKNGGMNYKQAKQNAINAKMKSHH